MVKDNLNPRKENNIMVNGKKGKDMAKEFLFLLMVEHMKENGRMICQLEKEFGKNLVLIINY